MSIPSLYTPAEAPVLAVQQVSLKHNNDQPALKKLMPKYSENTFKFSYSLCRLSSRRGARKKDPNIWWSSGERSRLRAVREKKVTSLSRASEIKQAKFEFEEFSASRNAKRRASFTDSVVSD